MLSNKKDLQDDCNTNHNLCSSRKINNVPILIIRSPTVVVSVTLYHKQAKPGNATLIFPRGEQHGIIVVINLHFNHHISKYCTLILLHKSRILSFTNIFNYFLRPKILSFVKWYITTFHWNIILPESEKITGKGCAIV